MLVAITGGIGCGKTYISNLLRVMGHQVYDCDTAAKRLMTQDPQLRQDLINAFGSDTYFADGTLNKKHLSGIIFNNPEALSMMNALTHPAVARDIQRLYQAAGTGSLFFYESAILFESHFNLLAPPHSVISISAPLELRIQRVMQRDNVTRASVIERIGNQMPQEEKDRLANHVIHNDNQMSVISQVETVLNALQMLNTQK